MTVVTRGRPTCRRCRHHACENVSVDGCDLFNLLGKFSSHLLGDSSLCLVDSWLTWWEVKFARSLPNRSGLPGTK